MTQNSVLTRALGSLLVPVAVLVAGVLPATAEEMALSPRQEKAPRILAAQVDDGRSRLTISAPIWGEDAALEQAPAKRAGRDARSLVSIASWRAG